MIQLVELWTIAIYGSGILFVQFCLKQLNHDHKVFAGLMSNLIFQTFYMRY
jgi:hypothetical protein